MSISPYIHKYSDNAALKEMWSRDGSRDTINYIDIKNIFENKKPANRIREQMLASGQKMGLSKPQTETFFKNLQAELEQALNPKNSTNLNLNLDFDTGLNLFRSSYTSKDFRANDEIDKYIKLITEIYKKADAFLTQFDKFINDPKALNNLLAEVSLSESALTNYGWVRTYRDDLIAKANNSIIQLSNVDQTKRYMSMLAQFKSLEAFLQQVNQNGGLLNKKETKSVIEHTIGSMLYFAGFLSGAIEEHVVAQTMDQTVKPMIEKLLSSSNFTVTSEHTGTQRQGLHASKGDVTINIQNNKNASISFQIPISVKATGHQFGSKEAISIESGASLENVLKTIFDGQIPQNYAMRGLFNIILHGLNRNRRKKLLNKKKDDAENRVYMYTPSQRGEVLTALSQANIVNALTGYIRKNSANNVFYIIVNRKVYSTAELLDILLENPSFITQGFSPFEVGKTKEIIGIETIERERLNAPASFDEKERKRIQEAASRKAYQQMMKLHYDIKLKMNLFK